MKQGGKDKQLGDTEGKVDRISIRTRRDRLSKLGFSWS